MVASAWMPPATDDMPPEVQGPPPPNAGATFATATGSPEIDAAPVLEPTAVRTMRKKQMTIGPI